MNHMLEGITAGKIKNGESITGNLRYRQTIKLSAAGIILLRT